MEPFSLAVRRRIIELFQSGLEGDDVAAIMACSPAAARRIWQRCREEGLIGPRPHAGGHTPKLDEQQKKQVLTELMAHALRMLGTERAWVVHGALAPRGEVRTPARVDCRSSSSSFASVLTPVRHHRRPRMVWPMPTARRSGGGPSGSAAARSPGRVSTP